MPSSLHTTFTLSHALEEMNHPHTLYPICSPKEEGYLEVSRIHSLYYATYGNPQGIPVIILHGGPGSGCHDNLTRFFDLTRWHVIMFDQRAAMRSIPFGVMEENNPHFSVADIEKLRKHLKIDKWIVFGGSWGSALALLYGEAHAEHCLGFILRGIFLAREQDYLHLLKGMGKIFPEAYQPFIQFLSEEERSDILNAYYLRIMHPDPLVHMPAARAFMRYDVICSTHSPNPAALEQLMQNDKFVLGTARQFLYYSKHNFFLEPNQILSQMHKIAHLPGILVQGRWDAICLPDMAHSLFEKWENSLLWIIPDGGHTGNEPAIGSALAKATDIFAEKISH